MVVCGSLLQVEDAVHGHGAVRRFAKSSPDAAANLDVMQKALYCNLESYSNLRVRKTKHYMNVAD